MNKREYIEGLGRIDRVHSFFPILICGNAMREPPTEGVQFCRCCSCGTRKGEDNYDNEKKTTHQIWEKRSQTMCLRCDDAIMW